MWEHRDWFWDQQMGPDASLQAEACEEYSHAWLAYMDRARQMLERRRKVEYDRLVAEREQHRRQIQRPEFPEHLL